MASQRTAVWLCLGGTGALLTGWAGWPSIADSKGTPCAQIRPSDEWISSVKSNLPEKSGYYQWELDRIDERNSSYRYQEPSPSVSVWGKTFTGILLGAIGRVVFGGMNNLHIFEVTNHRSIVDDPLLISAITPWWALAKDSHIRWGACAADICFRSKTGRKFMDLAKVAPIVRRGGLDQKELLDISERLAGGAWINYFPEGRVCQSGGIDLIRRGVGRVIEAAYSSVPEGLDSPLIIPIYHEGSEKIFPHNHQTNKLTNTFPKIGNDVYVVVGDPVDISEIMKNHSGCLSAPSPARPSDPNCRAMYDAISERLSVELRILRAELRQQVGKDQSVDLGDAFQIR